MKVTVRHLTVIMSLVTLSACSSRVEGSPGWRTSPIWDDGNAEFCAYEVEWWRYGRLNPGRALLILVKEPWAPDLDVKADTPRPDGFDVLKLNHIRDVPTGIYTYHQMASVFIRRQSGDLQKISATSSEGCGISTAQMTDETLETRSYFDGQGEQVMPYPDGSFPEDGLPMTLRDFVTGEAPDRIDVLPSLMAGRYGDLSVTAYGIERRQLEGYDVPAGRYSATELRLSSGSEWLSYVFSRDAPHLLLELRRSDGTSYRLAKCERIPYWRMNVEGGEGWLPEGVR
jgi:hypothetical protein